MHTSAASPRVPSPLPFVRLPAAATPSQRIDGFERAALLGEAEGTVFAWESLAEDERTKPLAPRTGWDEAAIHALGPEAFGAACGLSAEDVAERGYAWFGACEAYNAAFVRAAEEAS